MWRFDTSHVIRLSAKSEALAFALMRQMAFRSNRLIDLVLDLSLRPCSGALLYSLAIRQVGERAARGIPRQLDMNTVG